MFYEISSTFWAPIVIAADNIDTFPNISFSYARIWLADYLYVIGILICLLNPLPPPPQKNNNS